MKKLSKRIIGILDELKFYPQEVQMDNGEYYVEVNSSTPAGEDWWETFWYDGTSKGFAEAVRTRADNFDVDDEVEIWINGRGTNGIPNSIKTLVEDAEWKESRLIKLADALAG